MTLFSNGVAKRLEEDNPIVEARRRRAELRAEEELRRALVGRSTRRTRERRRYLTPGVLVEAPVAAPSDPTSHKRVQQIHTAPDGVIPRVMLSPLSTCDFSKACNFSCHAFVVICCFCLCFLRLLCILFCFWFVVCVLLLFCVALYSVCLFASLYVCLSVCLSACLRL